VIAIGDIVYYTLAQPDVDTIKALRSQRGGSADWEPVAEEQIYPALVVAIAPNGALNLQVFLNGGDNYWKQFAIKATDPQIGMWSEKSDWKAL
jgi:hypothetical protein